MFSAFYAWFLSLDSRVRAGILALGFPAALLVAAAVPAWVLLLVAGAWTAVVGLGMLSVIPTMLRERSEAGSASLFLLAPVTAAAITPAAAAAVPWEWALYLVRAVMLVAVFLLGFSIMRRI